MKNLLIQWENEKENRKIGGSIPLIDKIPNGNLLLIDRKLAELEDNTEYTSLPKLKELVKKPSNLTRIGKKKPHYPISHSLAYFIELIKRPYFCFAESLTSLIDRLAICRA